MADEATAKAVLDVLETAFRCTNARTYEGGRRLQPTGGQFVGDPAGAPAGMPATQLADLGFHLRRKARGTAPRAPGAIQQTGHALLLEPPPPAVQRLTRGAVPGRDLTDRVPTEHLADSPVAVLGQLLNIHVTDGSSPAASMAGGWRTFSRTCQPCPEHKRSSIS